MKFPRVFLRFPASRALSAGIFFVCALAAQGAGADAVVVEDPLTGSSLGEVVGGALTAEGYRPGVGAHHVLYRLPAPVKEGVITVEMKGFDGKGDDNGFVAMYDGRGISEPATFEAGETDGFRPFRENYFRWNIHWRDDTRWKAVLIVARPQTAEGLDPMTKAASYWRPVSGPPSPRDFTTEPNGEGYAWKAEAWENLKIEWKRVDGQTRFVVVMGGKTVWGPVTAPAGWDYHPREHRIWLGSAPGPNKYESKHAGTIFRNFKLVAFHDALPLRAPDAGASREDAGAAATPDAGTAGGTAGNEASGGTGTGGRAPPGGAGGRPRTEMRDEPDETDGEGGNGGNTPSSQPAAAGSGCSFASERKVNGILPFAIVACAALMRMHRRRRKSGAAGPLHLLLLFPAMFGCSAGERARQPDRDAGDMEAAGGEGGNKSSDNEGGGGGRAGATASGGSGGSVVGEPRDAGGTADAGSASIPPRAPEGAFFFDAFENGFDEGQWQNIWTTDWWLSSWVTAQPNTGVSGSGALWINTVLPAGPRQRDVLASYGKMALWGMEVAPMMQPRNVDIIKRLVADGTMKSGPAPLAGKKAFTLEMDMKFAADNRNRGGFLFRSSSAVPYPSGDSLNAYKHVIQYDGYAFVVSNHVFDPTAKCDGKVVQGAIASQSNVFIVKRPKATMDDRHNDLPYTLLARASHAIAVDEWFRLRLEVDGDRFKGYIDGQLVIEASDREYADRHHVGIHGYKHQRGNDWDCYTGTLLTSFFADNFTVYEGIPPLSVSPTKTPR